MPRISISEHVGLRLRSSNGLESGRTVAVNKSLVGMLAPKVKPQSLLSICWVACGCPTKGKHMKANSDQKRMIALSSSLLNRLRKFPVYRNWRKKDFLICQTKNDGIILPNKHDYQAQWEILCRFAKRNDIRTPIYKDIQSRKRNKNETLGKTEDKIFTKWRLVRYQALKRSDGRCECCGATPRSSREPLHVDHIKPKSLFPEVQFDLNNLQVLCADCNIGKGKWDQTNWRDKREQEIIIENLDRVVVLKSKNRGI